MNPLDTLIPARGVVEFHVYPTLREDDDLRLQIDGPEEWTRPVVALINRYGRPFPDPESTSDRWCYLPLEPVVADETGSLYAVDDYLETVVGGLHWDHTYHFYWPHVDGPVTDAPRIRELTSGASDLV